MRFDKPPLSFDQQLDRMIERGIRCDDRERALHYLAHLNYYRLAAYWLPFETDHAKHQVAENVCFDDILNLYVFDRELRLLVLDAIERIEISVRTAWAYHLAHRYGPHGHLDGGIFKQPGRTWNYVQQRDKLADEVQRSHETFIQHLSSKYDDPLPPVWAVVEIMTLGQLSKWYANLRRGADRNAVAHRYDMDEGNLTSFLHHLTIIRNICAHHGRLWNREFTVTFRLPSHRPKTLISSLNPKDGRRIYNTLALLADLMDRISPGHHWKRRLRALMEQHRIDPRPMGFPADFALRPLWADVWAEARR